MNKLYEAIVVLQASAIDYIRDQLSEEIWQVGGEEVKLQPAVRDQIEDVVYSALDDLDLPAEALNGLFIYGSILTNRYNSGTDVDCRIQLDPNIVYKKYGEDVTGDDIFDLIIEKVHGIPIEGTKHPLNCSIVIEGEDTELGRSELGKTEEDPVYDVLNEKIVVPPYMYEDIDPDEEFAEEREEADVIMDKLDDLLRELKTDTIDYVWLEDAVKDVKDKDELLEKLESKMEEIEEDVESLVEEYGDIKEMRTKEYNEGDGGTGPGNVKFKIVEKYFYLDVLRKLKRIFKGGVTEKEVEDIEEIFT